MLFRLKTSLRDQLIRIYSCFLCLCFLLLKHLRNVSIYARPSAKSIDTRDQQTCLDGLFTHEALLMLSPVLNADRIGFRCAHLPWVMAGLTLQSVLKHCQS